MKGEERGKQKKRILMIETERGECDGDRESHREPEMLRYERDTTHRLRRRTPSPTPAPPFSCSAATTCPPATQ